MTDWVTVNVSDNNKEVTLSKIQSLKKMFLSWLDFLKIKLNYTFLLTYFLIPYC